jgi:hypothetical protein
MAYRSDWRWMNWCLCDSSEITPRGIGQDPSVSVQRAQPVTSDEPRAELVELSRRHPRDHVARVERMR